MPTKHRRTRGDNTRDTVTVQIKKNTHKRAVAIAAAKDEFIGDFIEHCVQSVVAQEESQLPRYYKRLAAAA